jgi:hypothetical protein
MSKSAEAYFYEFRASADTDAAMSLLRSRDALLYLALMAAHLGEGQIVDGQSLAALIAADLPGLGAAAGGDDDGRAPDTLLRRWTRHGWVHRSIDYETRTERYQLEAQLAAVTAGAARPAASALADRIAALSQLIDRIPADVARYGERMHAKRPRCPVVEEADMTDHLLGYKPPADTDEAGFAKRARTAIRSLEEAHLIRSVPGTSRYLVYPVITAVLSAERVAVLAGLDQPADPDGTAPDDLGDSGD